MKALPAGVGEVRFLVVPHALERYAERASGFPDDPERARRQLGAIIKTCGTLGGEPEWVHDPVVPREETAVQWLLLGDDVALPLVDRRGQLVAITCLAKGGVSAAAREKRTERRRRRGRAKREVRQVRAWSGERAPRWQ